MEYESRRDADDAYHEMHNKRIGRDDLLKIEVGCPIQGKVEVMLTSCSGPAHLPPHRGDSTLAVTALVVSVLSVVTVVIAATVVVVLLVAEAPHLAGTVAALLARMIAASVTMTVATATGLGALTVTAK